MSREERPDLSLTEVEEMKEQEAASPPPMMDRGRPDLSLTEVEEPALGNVSGDPSFAPQGAPASPSEEAMVMEQAAMADGAQAVQPGFFQGAVDAIMTNPNAGKLESASPLYNTLALRKAPGFFPMVPEEIEAIIPVLAAEFPSMNELGIITDRSERVAFVLPIMENTALPSTVQAQMVDEIMRTGRIIPDALPQEWFEARGIPLQRRR